MQDAASFHDALHRLWVKLYSGEKYLKLVGQEKAFSWRSLHLRVSWTAWLHEVSSKEKRYIANEVRYILCVIGKGLCTQKSYDEVAFQPLYEVTWVVYLGIWSWPLSWSIDVDEIVRDINHGKENNTEEALLVVISGPWVCYNCISRAFHLLLQLDEENSISDTNRIVCKLFSTLFRGNALRSSSTFSSMKASSTSPTTLLSLFCVTFHEFCMFLSWF